jgi:protein-S-isoprenylcysteine O-methyltransferase Ste14
MWLAAPSARGAAAPLVLCAVLGTLIAGAGILAFRRAGTTVDPMRPEKAAAVVATGVYRYTRNPMYLGLALVLFGWGVYLGAPWLLFGPAAFVLFITRFQVIPEERALLARFGADYATYQRRVRRWV